MIDTTKKITAVSYNGVNIPLAGGSGGSYARPEDWLSIPTMSGTTDDVYILNGVIKNGMNMLYFKVSGTGTIDWGDGNTETFTNASQRTFSHHFDYDDVSSSSWTTHNNSRQVLVHISGNRGAITYFSTGGITYQYTNADNVTVNYNTNKSTDIYQISANVKSCTVLCSASSGQMHKKLEIFDWKGTITATNISYMFNNCYSLQSIPQLDTSKVTNMSRMFYMCYTLHEIPQLDTSSVTNMYSMFNYCISLRTIPQLDTSKTTSMSSMFDYCYSLQSIPQLDTSSVTSMTTMFQNCYSLQTIPSLDTSKVTNMSGMFNYCYSLQFVPQLDTSSVTNVSSMFSYCQSLQTIPQFDTSSVTNMSKMFDTCSSLQTVPQLDTSSVTNMSSMFNYCNSLQSVKVYGLNKSSTSAITLSNLTYSTILTKQALVDLFNSVPNSPAGTRTIQLGSTLQGYLANCYVKDSGEYYTTILPTRDTSVVSGKTYYTYNKQTDTYTQVTPDFTSDTFYYEGVTATWKRWDICESTDTGATLALTYITNKGYTIS